MSCIDLFKVNKNTDVKNNNNNNKRINHSSEIINNCHRQQHLFHKV